jgi:hypothetical protein
MLFTKRVQSLEKMGPTVNTIGLLGVFSQLEQNKILFHHFLSSSHLFHARSETSKKKSESQPIVDKRQTWYLWYVMCDVIWCDIAFNLTKEELLCNNENGVSGALEKTILNFELVNGLYFTSLTCCSLFLLNSVLLEV